MPNQVVDTLKRLGISHLYCSPVLAARHGSSLNTWIVNVLRGATREGAINIDIDLSSLPLDGFGAGGKSRGSKRMTGWV